MVFNGPSRSFTMKHNERKDKDFPNGNRANPQRPGQGLPQRPGQNQWDRQDKNGRK
jgi:hypothetical protein